jgi:uridine kinase
MDGIFLLRPELRQHWDLSIFLHADFEQTLPRGAVRDAGLFGSQAAAEERYQKRYIPGQKLYLREARPLDKADIVIDNNTIHKPRLIKISPTIAQENTQFSGT